MGVVILASQETSGLGLERYDDHGDLQISLLLQLGQNSCAEKDLALSNPVQVRVQVQVLDLKNRRARSVAHSRKVAFKMDAEVLKNEVWDCERVFTMRQQACLPSMKPLGIAQGVRISYLSHRITDVLAFAWKIPPTS